MEKTAGHRKAVLFAVALGAILIAGVYLRANNLVYCEFESEDGLFVIPPLNLVEDGYFPLVGPSLGDFEANHGPVTAYLLALPVAVSRSPIGMYLLILALNIATLLVIYRTARDFLSPGAALVALALAAFSSDLIYYSRVILDDSMTNIFVAISYYSFFAIITRKNNSLHWAILLPAVCLGIQIHFQMVITACLMIALLFALKPRIDVKGLLAGVFLVMLFMLPEIIYDLTQQDNNSLKIINSILQYVSGARGPYTGGEKAASETGGLIATHFHLFRLHYVIFAAAVAFFIADFVRGGLSPARPDAGAKKNAALLMLFSVVPLALLSSYHKQGMHRYFTAFIPMILLAGYFADQVFRARGDRTYTRALALCAKAAVVVLLICSAVMETYIARGEINKRIYHGISSPDYWMDSYTYRMKDYRMFLKDLRLDDGTFRKNVHGSLFYRMLGDGGYLYRTFRRPPPRKSPAGTHYLLTESKYLEPYAKKLVLDRRLDADALALLKYKSRIDYSSLKYSYSAGADWVMPQYDDARWKHFSNKIDFSRDTRFSEVNVWLRTWEDFPIFLRGEVWKPPKNGTVVLFNELTFSKRVMFPLEKEKRECGAAMYFNGKPVTQERAVEKDYRGFGTAYEFAFPVREEMFEKAGKGVFALEIFCNTTLRDFAVDVFDLTLK